MIIFFDWPRLLLALPPLSRVQFRVMHMSLKKCNVFHKILYEWNQIPVFIAEPRLQMFLFKDIFNRNSKV